MPVCADKWFVFVTKIMSAIMEDDDLIPIGRKPADSWGGKKLARQINLN